MLRFLCSSYITRTHPEDRKLSYILVHRHTQKSEIHSVKQFVCKMQPYIPTHTSVSMAL